MKLLLAAAAAALLTSCVIDLGGLSGGTPDGGTTGGASTTSPSSSGAGASGGGGGSGTTGSVDAGPGVLDCDPCPGAGCTPVALATGTIADGPAGIALASDGLYWVNRSGGTVMRLATTGGAPQMLATATAPQAIAAAGGYAVWGAQDGVYGCQAAACTPVKIAAATMMGSIPSIAYDGQSVFYADPGSGSADACPASAGCSAPIQLGNGYDAPAGMALEATMVFWVDQGNGNQNGDVLSSTKSGGSPQTIGASLTVPTAVVADDTYVYFTESTAPSGKILRCPYPGYCQTPVELAKNLAAPLDLALGGGRVYWTDSGDGSLLSCPVAGCGGTAPKVHASGRAGLRHLALGASCVFWTDDQGGGSVSKVAR